MARRGRPPHPELLTPRQQQVLSLVREGLSNREIAERLDITLNGAKFHVSEILTKIGVTSRGQAADWRSDAPVARLNGRLPRWHSARRTARLRAGWAAVPVHLRGTRGTLRITRGSQGATHQHRKLAVA